MRLRTKIRIRHKTALRMKRHRIITTALAAAMTVAAAHAQTDTLKVDTTYNLGEVTVNGMRVISKVDRQILLPTSTMKKHSSNGYDLLSKMTLNGIMTDPIKAGN